MWTMVFSILKHVIQTAGQGLLFCGVNVHNQNGKAKNQIKDMTEGAHMTLLHTIHHWPIVVYVSLRLSAPRRWIDHT